MDDSLVERIIVVRTRSAKEEIHRLYLNNLYENRVVSETEPFVDDLKEGQSVLSISCEEYNDAIIHNMAGVLLFNNQIALSMGEYNNTLYLKSKCL